MVGGGLTFLFKYYEMTLKDERFRSAGKAALGGSFMLTNHEGMATSTDDFKGEWVLLYFGFTACPDICPEELKKINRVITALDQKWWIGPVIRPLLVSIDPKRDTVSRMAEYIESLHDGKPLCHPRTVGLTGVGTLAEREAAVKVAARAYRVYYNPTNDDDEHYLVDHSIISYLLAPDGSFVAFYGQATEDGEMTEKIAGHVWEWKQREFWKGLGLLEDPVMPQDPVTAAA